MENKTKKCKHCQTDIPFNAKKCPNCQSDLRSWFGRHSILTVLAVLIGTPILLGIIFSSSNGGKTPPPKPEITAAIETNKKELKTAEDQQLLDEIIQKVTTISGLAAQSDGKNTFRQIFLDPFESNSPLEKKYGENARYVTIEMNSTCQSSLSCTRGTGRWASGEILQRVFPISQNIHTVFIDIFITTTDEYGKSKDSQFISLAMNKEMYNKINWSNFDYNKDMPTLLQKASENGDLENSYSENSKITE